MGARSNQAVTGTIAGWCGSPECRQYYLHELNLEQVLRLWSKWDPSKSSQLPQHLWTVRSSNRNFKQWPAIHFQKNARAGRANAKAIPRVNDLRIHDCLYLQAFNFPTATNEKYKHHNQPQRLHNNQPAWWLEKNLLAVRLGIRGADKQSWYEIGGKW